MTTDVANFNYLQTEYLRLFNKYLEKHGRISAFTFFINRFRLLIEFANSQKNNKSLVTIVEQLEECLEFVFNIRKERIKIQYQKNELVSKNDSKNRILYSYNAQIFNNELKQNLDIHSDKIKRLDNEKLNQLQLLNTYLYAISEKETIFVYDKPLNPYDWFLLDRLDVRRVRHPHLVATDALSAYCAGELVLFKYYKQFYCYLDNKSGHYLPDLPALEIARELFCQKLDLHKNNFILLDYNNGAIIY